jgi:hypothetical protein
MELAAYERRAKFDIQQGDNTRKTFWDERNKDTDGKRDSLRRLSLIGGGYPHYEENNGKDDGDNGYHHHKVTTVLRCKGYEPLEDKDTHISTARGLLLPDSLPVRAAI